jgi:hypothetical protein
LTSPGKVVNTVVQTGGVGANAGASSPVVELPVTMSVKHLADSLRASPIDIIKQLMRLGIFANINEIIDFQSAASVAAHAGSSGPTARRRRPGDA